jgi:hypothetical protein
VLSTRDETVEGVWFGLKRISYSDVTYGGGQVVVVMVVLGGERSLQGVRVGGRIVAVGDVTNRGQGGAVTRDEAEAEVETCTTEWFGWKGSRGCGGCKRRAGLIWG